MRHCRHVVDLVHPVFMSNNYDPVANIYDRLSRLVFGRALIRAQTCLLPYITPHSRVLIVGGGTGWILEDIALICPAGLHITYVEISAKMIAIAQQRNVAAHEIHFVQQSVETFTSTLKYDFILTAFLFDNFSPERAGNIFNHLSALLAPQGRWLFADFQYTAGRNAWWQRQLLQLMLLFFRITCRVEARSLTDMEPYFRQQGFTVIYSSTHYHHFIKSVVYRAKDLVDHT